MEAAQLFLQSGLRLAFADDPFNLLQLRVVEGKIAAGRNRLDLAATAFESARAEFLAKGRIYDAALVGLELAEVWLRQDKLDAVEAVAAEALAAFRKLAVPSEARRALVYLDQTCKIGAASEALITRIRRFVVRAQWREGLELRVW